MRAISHFPFKVFHTALATTATVVMLAAFAVPGMAKDETGAAPGEWPNWRGPAKNGISAERGWLAQWPDYGPDVLWDAAVGTGFSSLSIKNLRLYTMGNTATSSKDEDQTDQVFCLDAVTGVEIWKHTYPCELAPVYYKGGPSATPTVDGDRVYTFSKFGHLFCLDAKTGKVVWSRNITEQDKLAPPKWGFAGSVLVLGDLLVLNAGAGGIALDKKTGEVAWKTEGGMSGYSTPLPFEVNGQKGLAMFASDGLVAVDPATGKTLWKQPWKTSYDVNASDPIFSGDTVFISTGYGSGCALVKVGRDGLETVWRNKEMSNQCNSCVLWDGYLYGFNGNVGGKGVLRCLDLKTGDVKWSKNGLGTGSLMLADGKLIILSENGILVIAKAVPDRYEELQRSKILNGLCWTVPVLCNGRIYARCAEGELVCVDPKTKQEAGEE